MSNRRRLLFGGGNIPGKGEAKAGDILCATKDGNKCIIKQEDFLNLSYTDPLLSTWFAPPTNADLYLVGIVVVPPSHNVYGTGEGAAVSLNYMDCSQPDKGMKFQVTSSSWDWLVIDSDDEENCLINWGGYSSDSSNLPNILNNCTCTNNAGLQSDQLSASNLSKYNITGTSHIPFQASSVSDTIDYVCEHDTNTGYSGSSSSYAAMSPYLTDGSKNIYYSDNTKALAASKFNTLSDLDGKLNCETVISYCGDSYKTMTTINNDYGTKHFPGIFCCLKYYCIGTTAGDWYLPSIGEMGYLISRIGDINASLNKIRNNSTYSPIITQYYTDSYNSSSGMGGLVYLTSSWDSTRAITVSLSGRQNVAGFSNKTGLVRAFIRF